MTRNQILYQELQQTKRRDDVNAEVARGNLAELVRHNTNVEMETKRHNLVTEGQTDTNLKIAGYNAESGRMQAQAAGAQASAALQNAQTNVRMANIAQQNADTNRYDAETRRIVGQSQAALNDAEARIKNNEAANWIDTYFVEMDYKRTMTDYYDKQGSAATSNAESNATRALNDSQRVNIERILAASNFRLNESRIDNLDADTLLKATQKAYTTSDTVRKWIDTLFNGIDTFTRAYKAASQSAGGGVPWQLFE